VFRCELRTFQVLTPDYKDVLVMGPTNASHTPSSTAVGRFINPKMGLIDLFSL
jgi:hypothetical protein